MGFLVKKAGSEPEQAEPEIGRWYVAIDLVDAVERFAGLAEYCGNGQFIDDSYTDFSAAMVDADYIVEHR